MIGGQTKDARNQAIFISRIDKCKNIRIFDDPPRSPSAGTNFAKAIIQRNY